MNAHDNASKLCNAITSSSVFSESSTQLVNFTRHRLDSTAASRILLFLSLSSPSSAVGLLRERYDMNVSVYILFVRRSAKMWRTSGGQSVPATFQPSRASSRCSRSRWAHSLITDHLNWRKLTYSLSSSLSVCFGFRTNLCSQDDVRFVIW